MLTRLKLLCVALFWGGTFVSAHVMGALLPPPVGALLRFLVATAFMFGFAMFTEGRIAAPDRRLLLVTLLLGAVGIFGYNALFFAAAKLMPASRTALIVATNPVFTAVLSAALMRESPPARGWAGIALSFLGAVIVITHGDLPALLQRGIGPGELLMVGGVGCWALYTVLSQRLLQGVSPLMATTWCSAWGTLLLALYALPHLGGIGWTRLPASLWWNLLYMGIPGTGIAYVWFLDGVRRLGAPRAAVFNNFVPVFGVALSALLLGERPAASTLVGGAIVMTGVLITTRARRMISPEPRSPRRSSAPAGRGRG